ncbi:hypothetical protein CEXT_191401 [Caerostris extrusa]|uniref:Uncharacterized protein n=1 Tax=Caerostris extrusa TaxID=172846 RepID=A0AAV4YB64_CAEEX|nr:hypothetical protein CEXT_191401 [Caerostris extrusa]
MHQKLNMITTTTGSIFAPMECDDPQRIPSGRGLNCTARLRTKVSENVPRQRQCRKRLITPTSKSKLPSWGKGKPLGLKAAVNRTGAGQLMHV